MFVLVNFLFCGLEVFSGLEAAVVSFLHDIYGCASIFNFVKPNCVHIGA